MTSTIIIDDKEIAMMATALTKYRYRSVFGKELNATITAAKKEGLLYIAEELGYIMAKEAAGEGKTASLEDFEDWLSGFETFSFVRAANDIIGLYSESAQTTSKPKKKADQ